MTMRFYNDTDHRQCPAVDEQGLDCAAPEGHEHPHANVNGEWGPLSVPVSAEPGPPGAIPRAEGYETRTAGGTQ